MMKSNILKVHSISLGNLILNKFRPLSTETIKVKPHMPLIKFRKGGNNKLTGSEHNLSSSAELTSSIKGSGLDEDKTPIRYRRRSLTQLEMEAIESGGCY